MNRRGKKTEVKKVLVRNTSRPLPKTRYITEDDSEKCKAPPPTSREPIKATEKFHTPEIHSTLKIAKKIEFVENAKPAPLKAASNPAFDLNLTKKVNFPIDRAIYKDLISLHVSTQTQRTTTVRDPLPMKDLEPDLKDFAEAPKGQEFRYKSSQKPTNGIIGSKVNNQRLYKLLQLCNE